MNETAKENKFLSRGFVVSILLILSLFPIAALFLVAGGADIGDVLSAAYRGTFGSKISFAETLVRFIPLALIALGLIPSLRIGLFNIGALGQMGIGALFATLTSLALTGLPSVVVLTAAMVSAIVGGILWALIPALLRAYMQVNEILSTLVFNFLAFLFLDFLLSDIMRGARANTSQSDPLPKEAWLPALIPDTRAHIGLLFVFAIAIGLLAIRRGRLGYRLKLLGANENLARQIRLDAKQVQVMTMCFAGACAGLAGWVQLAGVDHRLYATVADPVGYTGLFAALLGALHPIGVLLAGFVFSLMLRGGDSLQIGADVSPEIVSALIGLILLIVSLRSSRLTQN